MWRDNTFSLTRFLGSSPDVHPWYVRLLVAFTHMTCAKYQIFMIYTDPYIVINVARHQIRRSQTGR